MMSKTIAEPAKTLLTIVTGLIGLSLLKGMHGFMYAALVLGLAGLLSDHLCALIARAWMKLAYVLGLIVPNILLTLIFFLVLFPLSILSKLFKKSDPLLLSNPAKSTFISVDKTFTKQSFEKPW